MEDFLNKLYSYEYFGTYLMIAIVVLLLLFVIILFFGKKDQKNREIEATKKLQQINAENTFKEENNVQNVSIPANDIAFNNVVENNDMPINEVVNDVATNVIKENIPDSLNQTSNKTLDQTIMVPNIESINDNNYNPNNKINNEVENLNIPTETLDTSNSINLNTNIPEINPVNITNKEINIPNNESINLVNDINEKTYEPIFAKEEEKPFVFNDFEADAPKIPEFNFDDVLKNIEEEKSTNEVKEEQPKVKEVFSSVFVSDEKPKTVEAKEIPKEEELDMELPLLKKEVQNQNISDETVKIDLPNLNDLAGETYNVHE